MKTMIGKYASYIYVQKSQKSAKTVELTNGVYVDYNEKGELIGIEILSELKPEYYEDYHEKEDT